MYRSSPAQDDIQQCGREEKIRHARPPLRPRRPAQEPVAMTTASKHEPNESRWLAVSWRPAKQTGLLPATPSPNGGGCFYRHAPRRPALRHPWRAVPHPVPAKTGSALAAARSRHKPDHTSVEPRHAQNSRAAPEPSPAPPIALRRPGSIAATTRTVSPRASNIFAPHRSREPARKYPVPESLPGQSPRLRRGQAPRPAAIP